MAILRSLIARNPISRWARTIRFLLEGARVHPSILLLGRQNQLRIGRSSTVGVRSSFVLSNDAIVEIEDHVWLAADIEIETDTAVRIGSGTTVQRRSTINGNVTIGRECILAPNVFISSGTHPFRLAPELSIREQERQVAAGKLPKEGLDRAITIGDDVWLGANVVIMPGVTIGKGCVVGANSVVTKSVHDAGKRSSAGLRSSLSRGNSTERIVHE